ncbi:MAG: DUF1080 domain-containing protein [Planctomycetota bacterium]|nr:DUF1080 domain-containing protein [Planctomycetota bacterium]
MVGLLLVPWVALAAGLEPVPVHDAEFDAEITTWTLEGSRQPGDARLVSSKGTPDTSSGQCLALSSGEAVRSCGPIIPAIPKGTSLDINLSLGPLSDPLARLKIQLINSQDESVAVQFLEPGQHWTRKRVSIPSSPETSEPCWLRLTQVGDKGGLLLIDNLAIERIGMPEPGFISLFDGETLEGWVGDTTGYEVQDGAIRCKPNGGGDLRSADEYEDFILRFEFKLTAGGNNGIAVRAPIEGNAAYEGMEIQVIDNTAEQYADLKPWQFHGSAYGIAPAERGWMLPPGQWNREEIRLKGDRLTVTLNGHVILDTHVGAILDAGPPSGAAHPGASRTHGHIGFCGHGSDVAFRKIRIQPLKKPGKDL